MPITQKIMKKFKLFVLSAIVSVFSFSYVASTKVDCDAECESISKLYESLRQGREAYMGDVYGFPDDRHYEHLVIRVNGSIVNVNWNLFADTVCNLAANAGLPHRPIYIVDFTSQPPNDTVARKTCP